MIDCPHIDQLRRMSESSLSGEEREAVAEHLLLCRECLQTFDQLATQSKTVVASSTKPVESTSVSWLDSATNLQSGENRFPTLPGYEIEAEIGRGGMGVVYRARHTRLNRLVALKMLTDFGLNNPIARARFLVEAEAVAQVAHTHVVYVHEFGVYSGMPYLAMEYLSGGTLAARLANPIRIPIRQAVRLIAQLADAVAAAHRKGVIHRDLKPSNILLAGPELLGGDDLFPKVTDFGIARVGDSGLTQTGEVLGTPSYMAPEQASGRTRDIGTTTDIYGLGAIFYEILTGRAPFVGETAVATLQEVVHTEPRAPRSLAPSIPRDLDTICRKCLEKVPSKRYANAEALAADLRAFLEGRTIIARPAGLPRKVLRFAKRNPAWSALGLSSMVAAIAFVIVLTISYVRIREAVGETERARLEAIAEATHAQLARTNEEAERRRAEALADENQKTRRETERRAARVEIEQGNLLGESGEIARCLESLMRAVDLAEHCGDADLTRVARINLAGWQARAPRLVRVYQDPQSDHPVDAVAYLPDGRVVIGSKDSGDIQIWSNQNGQSAVVGGWTGSIVSIGIKTTNVVEIVHDSTRKQLFIAHSDGRIWQRNYNDFQAKAEPPFEFASFSLSGLLSAKANKIHPSLLSFSLSPDVQRIAVGLDNHKVRVMDVVARAFVGNEIAVPENDDMYSLCLIAPDLLITGGRRGQIKTWHLESSQWRMIKSFSVADGAFKLCAFATDNSSLLLVGGDETSSLWDQNDLGHPLWTRKHRRRVGAVAFGPGAKTCVVADHEGNVNWMETSTGELLAKIRHPTQVRTVALSPNGDELLVGDADGRTAAWKLPTPPGQVALPTKFGSPGISSVRFEADGKSVWIAGNPGLSFWHPDASGVFQRDESRQGGWRNGESSLMVAELSPDGQTVLGADWGSASFHINSTRQLAHEARSKYVQTQVQSIGFAVGGDNAFFTITRDQVPRFGRLRWWRYSPGEAPTEDSTKKWPVLPHASCAVVRPIRGDLVLVGQRLGSQQPTGFRDINSGQLVGAAMPHSSPVIAVAFDSSGMLAATGCQDGSIRLWSVPEGILQAGPFFQSDRINQLTFGTGSSRGVLASASDDRTVRYWDSKTGLMLGPQIHYSSPILSVAFDPSGKRIVTGARSGLVRIWDAPPQPISGTLAELRDKIRDATRGIARD